ncbi:MAG: benzoate-CoA ligase family protein [Alphaproteobacteria bacterium]|nr:benzoate-CoA ligase family protein [Alphaproteobacteria bacterium]
MSERRALELPRQYNAATHFIDRHLAEGRAEKIAFIDDRGSYTYADLAQRVNRAGNMLRGLGLAPEQRVMLCLLDGIDFVAAFWGAIKIGAVPVPVNTLLTPADYEFMLRDSRARLLLVSEALADRFAGLRLRAPELRSGIVSAPKGVPGFAGYHHFGTLCAMASDRLAAAPTTCDDIAFWLYSSGSTGQPKGAMHLQSDLVQTAHLYGEGVLGVSEGDLVFSAAKLFFAYGLGNAMTFPLHCGATALLMAERPTPDSVMARLRQYQPTIFYGVPTLYAAILANPALGRAQSSERLRICVSAGEALPEEVARRWRERFGVEILDGIGSTEMLHIFLSNRPDDIRYGTTGRAVPGYELRIVDETGRDVADGEIGELLVKGPSAAAGYWNSRARSLSTFQGPWTRTGDKYVRDADGYYRYAGRADDMLKVSGIWVSPFEVESALMAHDQVLEAAVVGVEDRDRLVKPKAFVVARPGAAVDEALAETLRAFVKDRLAPYKYPRWIEFVDDLPKTATGKIQRFKLRQRQ